MSRVAQALIVILLAFIALQLADISQQDVDPTPGWHDVIRCPGVYEDGYYFPSAQMWCDDPNSDE
jgi:hypothetical protein